MLFSGNMKSSNGLLSFKQWLCIAFLVMACVFAASFIIFIKSLSYLHQRSLETTYHAVALSSLGPQFLIVNQSIERRARQHLILHDTESFENYLKTIQQGKLLIEELLREQVISEQVAQKWQTYTAQITQLLSEPAQANNSASDIPNQNDLNGPFRQLEQLQSEILVSIQRIIDHRNTLFSADIDQRQSLMRSLMAGLIVLALAMALAFGTWLARPFKRIEAAIVRLGGNQFETPIRIKGPTDVQKLGHQLDWLRIRLTEIDADKARFLRHTSHELKTPLAALREGISLLQEEVTGTLNSSQKDVVQILQQNAVVLQNQIEDLLQFNAAAFDARNLNRKPVNLTELIEDEVDAQQLQWQANNLQISITGEPVTVVIDANKISIAIRNLLSNAIRFSPPDSQINIHTSLQENSALIDIRDQGPGIDQQDRQHIFDPFYRGKIQPAAKTRGSGIGLSIVQEYIIAHGGKISLIPSDTGAHFKIELPYANL